MVRNQDVTDKYPTLPPPRWLLHTLGIYLRGTRRTTWHGIMVWLGPGVRNQDVARALAYLGYVGRRVRVAGRLISVWLLRNKAIRLPRFRQGSRVVEIGLVRYHGNEINPNHSRSFGTPGAPCSPHSPRPPAADFDTRIPRRFRRRVGEFMENMAWVRNVTGGVALAFLIPVEPETLLAAGYGPCGKAWTKGYRGFEQVRYVPLTPDHPWWSYYLAFQRQIGG